MCRERTPATHYCLRKLNRTPMDELHQELKSAPISQEEIEFLMDIRAHMSLKELAEKYNYSQSGVAKKKQRLFIRLHEYDMAKSMR